MAIQPERKYLKIDGERSEIISLNVFFLGWTPRSFDLETFLTDAIQTAFVEKKLVRITLENDEVFEAFDCWLLNLVSIGNENFAKAKCHFEIKMLYKK